MLNALSVVVNAMTRLPVLFDGGCPLCRRTVRIIRALDWFDRLQFVDATNAEARACVAPTLTEAQVMVEMYVVDERGGLHGGFEGYLQIARVVPLMWPFGLLARLPGLRPLGHAVYRWIAANRVRRGRCTDEVCAPAGNIQPR
jgi:predicted DCC family thiol-disulfide oxidoreductase YuxK